VNYTKLIIVSRGHIDAMDKGRERERERERDRERERERKGRTNQHAGNSTNDGDEIGDINANADCNIFYILKKNRYPGK